MKPRQLYLIAGLLVAGFVAAPPAHAEVVLSWKTDVNVSSDGSAKVRETIDYDPEDSAHHGLIRDIPAHIQDADGHDYYYDIQLISVADERGAQVPIAARRTGRSGLYLKLGSGSTTLEAGQHYYVITYTLKPVVTHTTLADRFNLNIIGADWTIPVHSAEAAVHFPGTPRYINYACYTGPAGGRASDCQLQPDAQGGLRAVATRPLEPNEAFTVDALMDPLGLGAYLEPGHPLPFTPVEKTLVGLAATAQTLVLGGVSWLMVRAVRQYRGRRRQTIIPIYEPPAGLSPAHLSILESPAADVADITATVLHLAVRGILKIELIQAKTWYRAANYRLIRLNRDAKLTPFERTIVDGIFAGDDSVELKNLGLKRSKLPAAIQSFRKTLGADLTRAGYFLSSPTSWLAGARWGTGLSATLLAGLAGILVVAGQGDALVFSGICAVVAGGLSVVFVWLCRQASGRSQTGNAEWAQVRGFRWFLEVTEKDRLKFFDAPEKTPELFSKMLPYAVALKVEKQWAKQFAGIDVTPAVSGWYAGYTVGNAFSADTFTAGFASGFTSAVSSGFSGSTGSGFSGGGVGGGGGGSW